MSATKRRGLTLIEILLTMAVLSLAVALVIPSMSQTGVLRAQAVARSIASDINLAQTEAMAYQTRRAMFFGAVVDDPVLGTFMSGNGYVVLEPAGSDPTLATLGLDVLPMPGNPTRPYVRNFGDTAKWGGAEITSPSFDGNNVLLFDELGGPLTSLADPTPSAGGTVRVVASDLDLAYTVTVQPMTGQVLVELESD